MYGSRRALNRTRAFGVDADTIHFWIRWQICVHFVEELKPRSSEAKKKRKGKFWRREVRRMEQKCHPHHTEARWLGVSKAVRPILNPPPYRSLSAQSECRTDDTSIGIFDRSLPALKPYILVHSTCWLRKLYFISIETSIIAFIFILPLFVQAPLMLRSHSSTALSKPKITLQTPAAEFFFATPPTRFPPTFVRQSDFWLSTEWYCRLVHQRKVCLFQEFWFSLWRY